MDSCAYKFKKEGNNEGQSEYGGASAQGVAGRANKPSIARVIEAEEEKKKGDRDRELYVAGSPYLFFP